MYIWMILATFMVLLYSFNLSVRNDMREIKIEPQAEVVVSQLDCETVAVKLAIVGGFHGQSN